MASKEAIAKTLNSWAANTGRTIPKQLPADWLEDFERANRLLLHSTIDRNIPMQGEIWRVLRTMPNATSPQAQQVDKDQVSALGRKYLPKLIELARRNVTPQDATSLG